MHIVTNPGSNLMPEVVTHYGLHLAPQRVVVDGVAHDTRGEVSSEDIDRWVATSKEFPHVVGTTAQEFALLFQALGKSDPEILVLTTSRKIIQSHAAATAAARSLASHPGSKHLKISIVDTTFTDGGAALLTILAAEAAKAGLSLREASALVERAAAKAALMFVPSTLEYLVKGGRAGWLRGFMADLLRLRPLIHMKDGELVKLSTVSQREDVVAALTRELERAVPSRRVWAAPLYTTGAMFHEVALGASLKRIFDMEYVYARPLSPSIYLHVGKNAVGAAILPLDDLPWQPPTPPSFTM